LIPSAAFQTTTVVAPPAPPQVIDPSKVGFITEYETDIRGSVELGERYLFVKCGEVKTGNDRMRAIQQLIKRLSIIRCALKHLLTNEERQRIVILMTGIIYSMVEPRRRRDSDIGGTNRDLRGGE